MYSTLIISRYIATVHFAQKHTASNTIYIHITDSPSISRLTATGISSSVPLAYIAGVTTMVKFKHTKHDTPCKP
jgi:hypothetical protein